MIDAEEWNSWLGLAEPPLEGSGCGKTNVIFYQLAMVSRDQAGSPGREASACGPVRSLAKVVAARLIGPLVSKPAGGRGREKEGAWCGEEEEEGGRRRREEEGKREQTKKKRG